MLTGTPCTADQETEPLGQPLFTSSVLPQEASPSWYILYVHVQYTYACIIQNLYSTCRVPMATPIQQDTVALPSSSSCTSSVPSSILYTPLECQELSLSPVVI